MLDFQYVAGLDRTKLGVYQFQSFLFIVVIVISILIKPTFWQISIYGQSLVKILERSDKEKITFKAIEKYQYGLWKTVSKHLKPWPTTLNTRLATSRPLGERSEPCLTASRPTAGDEVAGGRLVSLNGFSLDFPKVLRRISYDAARRTFHTWLAPILPTQKRVGALGPIRVAPKGPWG